jgi:error-prone DNA polymerase
LFCLGVTEVDPSRGTLLFEGFISKERNERPTLMSISNTSGAKK